MLCPHAVRQTCKVTVSITFRPPGAPACILVQYSLRLPHYVTATAWHVNIKTGTENLYDRNSCTKQRLSEKKFLRNIQKTAHSNIRSDANAAPKPEGTDVRVGVLTAVSMKLLPSNMSCGGVSWVTTNVSEEFTACILYIFPNGATAPSGPGPPHYRGFTITLRHTIFSRNPLDE
jgi:hypothetical protein